ncbi:hypothetical protein EYF80_009499 [Liparis tanakae]|uniref:Uncharacterized protein n=1 Tax=Liparis tanakae TaxID=230148 RepID=A0A4Z2IRL7_9TELE|nr:hypothetical protein EYF80_009499 [Liparis tanakae]
MTGGGERVREGRVAQGSLAWTKMSTETLSSVPSTSPCIHFPLRSCLQSESALIKGTNLSRSNQVAVLAGAADNSRRFDQKYIIFSSLPACLDAFVWGQELQEVEQEMLNDGQIRACLRWEAGSRPPNKLWARGHSRDGAGRGWLWRWEKQPEEHRRGIK